MAEDKEEIRQLESVLDNVREEVKHLLKNECPELISQFDQTCLQVQGVLDSKIDNETIDINIQSYITRNEFMQFFRNDSKLETLSNDDRCEIFMSVLSGGSDITPEVLKELCSDYGVENIDIRSIKNSEEEELDISMEDIDMEEGLKSKKSGYEAKIVKRYVENEGDPEVEVAHELIKRIDGEDGGAYRMIDLDTHELIKFETSESFERIEGKYDDAIEAVKANEESEDEGISI